MRFIPKIRDLWTPLISVLPICTIWTSTCQTTPSFLREIAWRDNTTKIFMVQLKEFDWMLPTFLKVRLHYGITSNFTKSAADSATCALVMLLVSYYHGLLHTYVISSYLLSKCHATCRMETRTVNKIFSFIAYRLPVLTCMQLIWQPTDGSKSHSS